MANSNTAAHSHQGELRHDRRANPTGAYVATAGVVVFLIATFLDWVSTQDDKVTGSGYETDTSIPLIAFLGLGLAAALLYALNRARGRQHRGLSLTTMAAGIAAAGLALSYIFDAPGALERGSDYSAEIGAWIGLVGAIVWAVGAFMLAKEPEGDDDWHDTERVTAGHTAH
jgi:ABC-type Fe3+-siderophore transport system permease subunit